MKIKFDFSKKYIDWDIFYIFLFIYLFIYFLFVSWGKFSEGWNWPFVEDKVIEIYQSNKFFNPFLCEEERKRGFFKVEKKRIH